MRRWRERYEEHGYDGLFDRLLESANIKLASVATDVFGVSGRRMLQALIEGTASASEMAQPL